VGCGHRRDGRQPASPRGRRARLRPPVAVSGPPDERVDAATTSVQYLRQSARTLAGTAVIRALDATSTKPETSSTVEFIEQQLQQVATVNTGIPRIHAAQPMFQSIVAQDLRLSVNDGLDEIVRRGVALAGTIVKGADDILEVPRKAMTLVQAEGYNPDTLAIDAAGAQSLDLLRTPGTEKFYIWGPGQTAGGPFGAHPGLEAGGDGGARLAGLWAACTSRRSSSAALRPTPARRTRSTCGWRRMPSTPPSGPRPRGGSRDRCRAPTARGIRTPTRSGRRA
jgi:hypothetical protein